jgi:hypothetical protein
MDSASRWPAVNPFASGSPVSASCCGLSTLLSAMESSALTESPALYAQLNLTVMSQ